jgi:zinc metalloprotease ZmpB
MIIRLVPGQDFTPADVAAAKDKTIQLWGYAGGILVGGMSYQVDPNLKSPKGDGGHHHECGSIGEELLKCVDVAGKKVRRVRVRKVNVDIEIDDDC